MLTKYLAFIIILSLNVFATDPDPYVEALKEKRILKLSNGNEVLISYHSHSEETVSKTRIFMRNSGKILWDRTFVNEYDELWYRAYFIPVTKDNFIEDLNNDGFLEIGIANWDGGKAPCASSGLIFSIKEDSIQFLQKHRINTEFSRQIYRAKNDFNNPKYRDPLCKY
jgi:hypothetical protein